MLRRLITIIIGPSKMRRASKKALDTERLSLEE